ncbi:DNA primase [Catalinimonas niigatensis]|uniref:DNA primase n=1 Tax=Catalinimonas niigatensis TaxID=1397264 RepID=UPI002665E4AC|nr:DNA primase [Catalinimonas niigatensis]WPP51394.1 DNA primase [Catalinimonas niigatensis]
MIRKEIIDEIKARIDILDVVGDYVNLKKQGSNYRGFSPFNQEKTPSFYVVPSKGFYKDFSSGKAGDAISFMMESEGMSYIEALKQLGKRYGIEVEEENLTDEEMEAQSEKDSLYIVMKYASDYFQEQLWKSEEGKAIGLTYFKERGFSEETIKAFDLGYSLDEWDGMLKMAIKVGHKQEMLEKAGLIISRERKEGTRHYDRFRGRVMFPIHNISGRVIAFGARLLKNNPEVEQPKYLNSPETPIYHKSDVLYGIYQAKQQIRQEDTCYLVEGYTDVISLYQAGIQNVVASSGTSLTQEQIRLIARYTKNVTVLFDGDPAGLKASFRGIDMILEGGLNVKAVVLPEGEDPDSYVRKLGGRHSGGSQFREFLQEKQQDFISFKTAVYQEETERDPIRRAEVIREIVQSISKIPDPIQRQVYIKETSVKLGMDESTLFAELNKIYLKQQRSSSRQQTYEEQEKGVADIDFVHPEEPLDEPASVGIEEAILSKEKELTRVLVMYGHHPVKEDYMVCHYIKDELDDISLKHDIYQRIFSTYYQHVDTQKSLMEKFMIEQTEAEVSRQVINLIVDHYMPSPNWEQREVYVPKKDEKILDVITRSIDQLKFDVLKFMLAQKTLELKDETDINNVILIQKELIELQKIYNKIANKYGTVVPR